MDDKLMFPEQAAVRAALEGLRAEVAATGHHIDCAEGCDCGFDAALALIDARLAALT